MNDEIITREGYMPPEQLEPCLEIIRQVAGREVRQIELYNYLIDLTAGQTQAQQAEPPIINERAVLRDIRDLDQRNLDMLEEIYQNLTGSPLVPIRERFVEPTNYRRGLEQGLFDELRDVELYRRLYNGTLNRVLRDMYHEMILNSLINADKLNYLYSRRNLAR